MHVRTLRDDIECGYMFAQTWVGVCVHVSFISWTTLPLHQFTSGHTARTHGGLVAWEAVQQEVEYNL